MPVLFLFYFYFLGRVEERSCHLTRCTSQLVSSSPSCALLGKHNPNPIPDCRAKHRCQCLNYREKQLYNSLYRVHHFELQHPTVELPQNILSMCKNEQIPKEIPTFVAAESAAEQRVVVPPRGSCPPDRQGLPLMGGRWKKGKGGD